jgi:hypothetical protein
MTLFEYLAIAYSLVLSFSAMRLIEGLPKAIDPRQRDWTHLVSVCTVLLWCVTTFWLFWSYRESSWTYHRFLLALASPGLNYFMACTLIPRESEGVTSWRSYFRSVKTRYFGALACWVVVVAALTTVLVEMPLWGHGARRGQLVILTLAIVGVVSKGERTIAVVAWLFLLFTVWAGLGLGRPGPLAME